MPKSSEPNTIKSFLIQRKNARFRDAVAKRSETKWNESKKNKNNSHLKDFEPLHWKTSCFKNSVIECLLRLFKKAKQKPIFIA